MSGTAQTTTVRTVCQMKDCRGCGLLAHVTDGVISKVTPAEFQDPSDQGACAKGLATHQLTQHPDRLRHPLKRVGERGAGHWERVSWDEALDGIADQLKGVIERHGPKAIAWIAPILGYVQGSGYSRLASLTKATWVDVMGFGDAAGPCADIATFGRLLGERHISSVKNPKFSIVWGNNPAFTEWRRMQAITESRKNGCKVVAIDPRRTATASLVDAHISIRPGTDGALALAMIQVILEQGLQDERFIAENTVGPLLVRSDTGLFLRESDLIQEGSEQRFMVFDEHTDQAKPCDDPGIQPALTGEYALGGIVCQPAYQRLADSLRQYTPEWAEGITDVPADTIRQMALDYATQKPASIYRGWGMQRSFYADLSCRAINTLAAVTGNINPNRPFTLGLNTKSLKMPGDPHKPFPILKLYDAISKQDPFAIKAMIFAGSNFVNQLPNMNRITQELIPPLDLIVVCDLFMTTSAKYADYVLPVTSFYERPDLRLTPLGNTYLALPPQIIEPLHEARSDFEIASALGRRMGFGEYFTMTEQQCIEELLASGYPAAKGITLETLRQGPVMVDASERPPRFGTPTGRIEFYVERLKPLGQELPIFIEPVESLKNEKAKTYPLVLLTTHPKNRTHSIMANVSSLHKSNPEPTLEINPVDAESRTIADGDVVRVFNDRGDVKLKAKITSNIRLGAVNIEQGWWPEHFIEGHHNQLTHEKMNPAQALIYQPNAAYYDVLVEVEKD